jgi:hypothetical protein
MADFMVDERGNAPVARKSISTLANWIGAGLSCALIIGVGVWSYKLVMRDVNGIPVVRAMEGPMRLQPETPGGSTADHLGLAVNQVAGSGVAAPPADRLVLAPRPVTLTEEDVPAADLMALAQVFPMPMPAVDPSVNIMEQTTDLTSLTADQPQPVEADVLGGARIEQAALVVPAPDSMSAMVDQILAQVLESAPADGDSDAATAAIAIPPVEGGIGQSLRPQARPASIVRASASLGAVAVQPAPLAVQDVDAASIPAGTRLVQLGAYDSPEVAKREWDRLATRFGDYLQGKSRVIQLAESGGRNFYRLRAMGFADINDSRRFCSALLAERAECIPVSAK